MFKNWRLKSSTSFSFAGTNHEAQEALLNEQDGFSISQSTQHENKKSALIIYWVRI
jgi:hypothetical protein